MRAFIRDLRYALRQLRKSPGFTFVVVLTLALGIGANTAVFSVMNSILMQLLPVSRPHGLYYVRMANGEGQAPGTGNTGDSNTSFSEGTFEALRQRTDVFEELIGYAPLSFNGNVAVRHGQLPEEAEGEEVSGNFFSGLSARMGMGRGFEYADEKDHAQIAVISYEFWTRSFARDASVLGQTLHVKGVPLTIVGVTARGFKGIEPAVSADFWIPLQNRPELNVWGTPAGNGTLYGSPKWWCLRMMTRLRPGVTPMQAQQALTGTFGGVVRQTVGTIDEKQWKPLLEFVPAKGISGYNVDFRTPVEILMGLVGLVLVIACTNVAMMVEARNTAREHEFSLRMAIGAGKASIFRQLLSESVLVVVVGALLGWMFAESATRMLASLSGVETGLNPDRTVLLFTIAISAVAALAFGLIPLWSAARVPVAGVLRSTSGTTTATRSRLTAGRVTLSSQIAISLVLLVSAGLLLGTLRNYATQNLGIESQGLLVFGVTPQRGVEDHAFYRQILDRVKQIPGVEIVSLAENRPGSGWSDNNDLVLDGVRKEGASLRSNSVGPDFFRTMGVPMLAGRDIAQSDTDQTERVAVVNETLVKKFLQHTNPIGHQLGGPRNPLRIVGVVRDSKYTSVDEEPRPMAFYAAMQFKSMGNMHVEVRTRGEASSMLPAIRKAISTMYPDVPLEEPMTQEEQFAKSYEQQRMFAALGGFFGVLAALLVATGLYGAHSFRVSRRSTEIGVRMALGATRGQVLTMFLRESLWVLLTGVAVGIPLTLFAIRPLKSMLYQMSPFDVPTFLMAIVAIGLVSGVAALVPARRAASIDPMIALRNE
jgi:predicted permease